MAYRLMTVLGVFETKPGSGRVNITFHDSTAIIQLSRARLMEKGLADIFPGQKVRIKGRYGNDDCMLATPDSVTDIIRVYSL